ncbi:MAG: SGNH/GDSL hydrolase family protein [Planctomycetes bacterium]|nr:SGNH/GDSL hydrolase family protein [Planctomycetota bacterium]
MAELRRKRRGLRALLALFVGLVAVDLGLTAWIGSDGLLLGHPLPPFGAITHPRQRAWLAELRAEPRGTGAFDAELGWTVLADATSLDGKARTNSIGARGPREYALANPASVTRVVCVGDSYTWCDEVGDADTFEAQLEALRPDVECINLGVPAYGTDQALLRWRRDGERLAPDVLVVGLLLENIGRNVNRYRPLWYPGSGSAPSKPRFVLVHDRLELVPQPFASGAELADAIDDGSVLARLDEHEHWRWSSSWWGISSLACCVAALVSDRERDVERLWRDEAGEPFQTTLALLREFRAKRVLVALFPREVDLEGIGAGATPYWSGLRAALDRAGLEHVDVAPELARALADRRRDPSLPHPYVGGHLSRAGNRIVASELDRRLR